MNLAKLTSALALSAANSFSGLLLRATARATLVIGVLGAAAWYMADKRYVAILIVAGLAAVGYTVPNNGPQQQMMAEPPMEHWRQRTPWLKWASGWAAATCAVTALLTAGALLALRLADDSSAIDADFLLGLGAGAGFAASLVVIPAWITAASGPGWAIGAGSLHGVLLLCLWTVLSEKPRLPHAPADFGFGIKVFYTIALILALAGVARTGQIRRRQADTVQRS